VYIIIAATTLSCLEWRGNKDIDQVCTEYSLEVLSDSQVERIQNIVSIGARLLFQGSIST